MSIAALAPLPRPCDACKWEIGKPNASKAWACIDANAEPGPEAAARAE